MLFSLDVRVLKGSTDYALMGLGFVWGQTTTHVDRLRMGRSRGAWYDTGLLGLIRSCSLRQWRGPVLCLLACIGGNVIAKDLERSMTFYEPYPTGKSRLSDINQTYAELD